MTDIHLRPAVAADQPLIRQMVRAEDLDPTSLHWSHFLVAEQDGEVVGIGQIRPYPTCRELGSLIVKPTHRQQGIGTLLMKALLARETGDVYLECPDYNEAYYERFGFVRIPWWRAPVPLSLKTGATRLLGWLFKFHVVTMRRAQP